MATGAIKWFSEEKGFGFITVDEPGGADMFVHKSEVTKAGIGKLVQGSRLSYDTALNSKTNRVAATNLKLLPVSP